MNLTLVILIFFFLAAVIAAAVFYYLTLQNLAAVKREVDKLRDQADDARSSALLRNERARCYQQLLALESAIQGGQRDRLSSEEMAMVELNREEIQNCVNALKKSGNWMGIPFDLDWQEMWDKLPQLRALYRAQAMGQDASVQVSAPVAALNTDSSAPAASSNPAAIAPTVAHATSAAAPNNAGASAAQDNAKMMATAMKNMMRG